MSTPRKFSFRDSMRNFIPPWLSARTSIEKTTAFRFLYCIAWLADIGTEHAVQALQARYPGLGTPTALPYIGRDRRIFRGFAENDASYSSRLVNWLSTHKRAGNPFGIMHEVQAYLTPYTPMMRIVNNSGTWYTLNPDGTEAVHETWVTSLADSNWNWDDDGAHPIRFALIIYSDQGPFTKDRKWGDGGKWGDGRTWGTSATREQVDTIKAIIAARKNAGDVCEQIIIAFDPASFDPTAAQGSPGLPDGNWNLWPNRLSTARYWGQVA